VEVDAPPEARAGRGPPEAGRGGRAFGPGGWTPFGRGRERPSGEVVDALRARSGAPSAGVVAVNAFGEGALAAAGVHAIRRSRFTPSAVSGPPLSGAARSRPRRSRSTISPFKRRKSTDSRPSPRYD